MGRLPRSRRGLVVAIAAVLLASAPIGTLAADPIPSPAPSGPIGPAEPGAGGPAPAGIQSGSPIVLPRAGTIVVQTIRSLAAVSIDDLSLAQPTSQFLIADAAHVATTVTIGPFTTGTSLVFSLHSSFTGQTYLSTGGNAIVLQDGTDRWAVAWEDWTDYAASDRPLTEDLGRGLNWGDAILSGGVGALTGPLGGITFAPTRILATAAYGCAATFASQAMGGRTSNLGETGIGCVFGAVAGIPKITAPILSGLYGFLVATGQTIANWATSGQGATSPSGGK